MAKELIFKVNIKTIVAISNKKILVNLNNSHTAYQIRLQKTYHYMKQYLIIYFKNQFCEVLTFLFMKKKNK